ncbi:MAG: single-stranded-DNA-specific exonuclease RecJ, partial [Olsenella sp.]|nr:single-stranded-DNA-specific exonuclease RecJ [Olsenella sp.]
MPGILDSRKWAVLPQDPQAERRIADGCGVSRIVARTMVARGIDSIEAARAFLSPSLERDWADPLLIPGMADVANRVERAVADGERIAVFGDFDVDGMSATCLLTLALRELGASVFPYIPDRFGEGYGLSAEALLRVMERCHPDLIVTVDNGIAAKKEVEWLLSRGVDVAVTDHHEPAELVPVGVPVTDPKLERDCSSRELAGAGVALKLVQELGRRLGRSDLWRSYTEVATLGTISDMMLLEGENRALVADGVANLRHTRRPGIVALAATAGVDLSSITADELPFSIIPRLNAAGRMGSVEVAFDLLITNDPAEAAVLAAKLEQTNAERRETESSLTEEAMSKVEKGYRGGRSVVVWGEGWHEGVKGIVASRITNRYHVPSIVFSVKDGVARGSGRSVGSVDLFRVVEQCSDLLVRFGGHAGAVGVTCKEDMLPAFASRLESVLEGLEDEEFEDRGEVTALVELSEMSVSGIESLEVLQPFGQGNKKPLFAVRGVTMRNRARVGQTQNHLRFVATDGFGSVQAIMFRVPDIERASNCESAVDLVFEPVNETWQGRTKPKLMVRDILYRDEVAHGLGERSLSAGAGPSEDAPSLADELFAHAESTLSRDEYASIGDAWSFMTKVVGVSFEGRQEVVRKLSAGEALRVVRDAANEVDPCAIAIETTDGVRVGYLRRQIAGVLAPIIDGGARYSARVEEVTGGTDGRSSLGLNVEVTRLDDEGEQGDAAGSGARVRERLSQLGTDELTDELTRSMIGDHSLLPAQKAAIDRLAEGRSTLCVMATGRGKSLIFHIHAAREALLRNRASVFVYPLRALVSDQSFHLADSFGRLGMTVRVLTGETSASGRDETFASLADGSVDVLLTTPEFLTIHVGRFAASGRISFVVVDEAHHAGSAKGGNRSAYLSMPNVLDALGRPVALAVTATAADDVSSEICRLLSIAEEDVVVDASVRENLLLRDYRDLPDREAALVSIVSTGMKTVVYVNSREQSVSLARMLRRSVVELGQRIAFYNAGLSRDDRSRVEAAFRSGDLSCIVSTSAFGEGVNLPDIRNVVLYHMPFGSVEFNQMSGRAGRDGQDARVYLLFGPRDARINERIIGSSAPERSELVVLYRTLRSIASQTALDSGDASFTMTNAAIAQRAFDLDARTHFDEHSVSCGISVFGELGFLETSGYGSARRIRMV